MATPRNTDWNCIKMDPEKLRKIGMWIVRTAMAGVLIYFMWNIILTQHTLFE